MKTRQRMIYTYGMAQALINQGFMPVSQAPNARDMTKTVWLFDSTPEFEAACADYIAESARAKANKPETKKTTQNVSNEALADLYLIGNQNVETIARVHGVTVERVLNAIRNDRRVVDVLRYAALTSQQRAKYNAAQTDEERETILQACGNFCAISGDNARTFVGGKEVE
ncbi:MAG: hypothetical protein E7425_07875 [Ruminococcaceae bacterium]|nr:hypothetical protein [Oscillospiraceae bacterium]